MSTLNEVLSGLHETDRKLKDKVADVYSKVGLSAIQEDTSLLNSDSRINPAYNSLKVASMDLAEGKDQLQKIKFTGNCKVTFGADGSIATIRIGDNLNSSNLGTKDGTTDGTNVKATATGKTSGTPVTGTPASDVDGTATNIYKSVGFTVETKDFIHFEDVLNTETATTGYLIVKVGKDQTPTEFEFGPLTSGSGPWVTSGVTLNINNWTEEANTATGANGYQGKLQFVIPNAVIDELASNADICFEVRVVNNEDSYSYAIPGTYFKTDPSLYNSVPELENATITVNETDHRWNSGIQYISQGNVVINIGNITNLNNPAKVADAVDVISDQSWFGENHNAENGGITKSNPEDEAAATASYYFQLPSSLVEDRIFCRSYSYY